MSDGWVKLHRKILDNPVVCKDGDHFAIWCYLLLNATHKEYDVIFGGKRITLKPGQLITGRKVLADVFKINESKVQRILKTLESEQQIEQQKTNKNRLISILNWHEYQESEQQNEQQVNNKRTTTEQQVNTNKNVKNIKNKRNNIYTSEFEECWSFYLEVIGKTGNKKKGFEKFNETFDKYTVEEIKGAIQKYSKKVKAEQTEDKYIKSGAYFFDVEYIEQYVVKNKTITTGGITLREDF